MPRHERLSPATSTSIQPGHKPHSHVTVGLGKAIARPPSDEECREIALYERQTKRLFGGW
jgi:predicted nucleic acid-binding Zn ribbon protein